MKYPRNIDPRVKGASLTEGDPVIVICAGSWGADQEATVLSVTEDRIRVRLVPRLRPSLDPDCPLPTEREFLRDGQDPHANDDDGTYVMHGLDWLALPT